MTDTPEQDKEAGRPTDYTEELTADICDRLSDGESLRAICSEEAMPDKSTVMRWLGKHETFRDQYAQARKIQADALFDEILDIADDGRNDWMKRNGEDNDGWVNNGEAMQRSRLRVDARKWMAGKLRPKKYGEKIVAEHSGVDGGPIKTETADTSDHALALKLFTLVAKGQKDQETSDE